MITEERRKWLESTYEGFTKHLFAVGYVPNAYIVAYDNVLELMPGAPPDMSKKLQAEIIASYARTKGAEFIIFVMQGYKIPYDAAMGRVLKKEDVEKIEGKEESMVMMIGEPTGRIHSITGKVLRTADGTPYVQSWEWSSDETNACELILPFCDDC